MTTNFGIKIAINGFVRTIAAGWIKMALGVEVGLGPGHIVLDGDPAHLPKKGAEPPPIFGRFLL